MTLRDQIEDARAHLARLEHCARAATCAEVGCDMRHVGGRNAGCGDECCCSVPVYACTRCGDSDYGDNEEAARQKADCEARWPPVEEPQHQEQGQ